MAQKVNQETKKRYSLSGLKKKQTKHIGVGDGGLLSKKLLETTKTK